MQLLKRLCFGLALASTMVSASQAALPTGSLSFTERVGTASPTDTIEVWVTLTLSTDSSPLSFSNGNLLSAMAALGLPQQGYVSTPTGSELADYASYLGARLSSVYVCSGNFYAPDCTPGPYTFSFNTPEGPGSEPPRTSIDYAKELDLQPGDSFSYMVGSFAPLDGSAPEGTYQLYNSRLYLSVQGIDTQGRIARNYVELARTHCAVGSSDCAFTRTVLTPVPEPSTWALMALGCGILCTTTRRSRRR